MAPVVGARLAVEAWATEIDDQPRESAAEVVDVSSTSLAVGEPANIASLTAAAVAPSVVPDAAETLLVAAGSAAADAATATAAVEEDASVAELVFEVPVPKPPDATARFA
jgi:hypothetical protein